MANLLAELVEAIANGGVEQVPAGWQTAQQLADESGKSLARTSEVLRQAIRAGLVEVRTFRIRTSGKVYPVPHYRKKKTPDHSGA